MTEIDTAAIEAEYAEYARTGTLSRTTNVYLQQLPAVDENGANPMNFPAHVWVTQAERIWLLQNLKKLAELGIVAAIGKTLYARLKEQNTDKARAHIQRLNAHNEKLGFDYSVKKGAHVYSNSA